MIPVSIRKRWLFYLALIIFIISKAPDLHRGFYWDENLVYAPAVHLMHAHGPSLLPGAIPPEYSRGHPLFFQVACATWMNVFGTSHFSMHCFSLFISVLLAIVLYELMLRLFNNRVALISGAFLLLNINFYASSSFVLTDIMFTLSAFLGIYCYIKEKHLLAALFLTLLVLTKETGIVLVGVLGLDILFSIPDRKLPERTKVFNAISVIIPLILVAVFFVLQKRTNGWYLFPYHTSLIDLSPDKLLLNLQKSLTTIFYFEKAWLYVGLFAVISAIAAYKLKKVTYLLVPLSAIIIYLALLLFSPKDLAFYVCVLYLVIATIVFFIKYATSFSYLQNRFLRLSVAFSVCFICFSCTFFLTERYLFPVSFLLSVIFLSVLFDLVISKAMNKQFTYVLGLIILLGLNSFRYPSSVLDFRDRLDVEQHLVNYMEENSFYDKAIYCNSPTSYNYLIQPFAGFLSSDKTFKNFTATIDETTELATFDNIDGRWGQNENLRRGNLFALVYRYQKGIDWVEVYRRK